MTSVNVSARNLGQLDEQESVLEGSLGRRATNTFYSMGLSALRRRLLADCGCLRASTRLAHRKSVRSVGPETILRLL